MRLTAALVAAFALALAAAPAANTAPRIAGCPVFPPDNPWNQRVDRLPVHRNSDAIVRSIGLDDTMHADFGSGLWEGGPIGIPFVTVAKSQPKVPVSFDYPDESDRGPYPIPPNVPIEGGRAADGDRHVILPGLARYDEVSAAGSTTRCASRRIGLAGRSCTRRATSPPTSPTPTCPRWASACA
jgi:hypothetical protein